MKFKNVDPQEGLNVSRIETLSDGVFAIVMTLLIFDIKPPSVNPNELSHSLLNLWPHFLGYIVSFALLGIYWLGHLTQFKYIHSSNHTLNWINILFLSFIALLPFSTRLISNYPRVFISIILYASNLSIIGIILYIHWSYATHNYRLVNKTISPHIIKYAKMRCLVAPLGYLFTLPIALISPTVSLIIFIIIPLLYIIPPLQNIWLHLINK